MIASTLSGVLAVIHPKINRFVRVDGMVNMRIPNTGRSKIPKCHYTEGFKSIRNKYNYTCMKINTKGRDYIVARLVAECFIPNPYNKPTVDHIDRDPTNNKVSNLRWADYKEQVENSGTVINRHDYGVRSCEDMSKYQHNRYIVLRDKDPDAMREKNRLAARRFRERHKYDSRN